MGDTHNMEKHIKACKIDNPQKGNHEITHQCVIKEINPSIGHKNFYLV